MANSQNSQNSQKSPKPASRAHLSAWYPKKEAAQFIGCSEKLIEQLAQKKELHQEMYKRPDGGPRIAVYHPADVKRIAARRNAEKPHVLEPAQDEATNRFFSAAGIVPIAPAIEAPRPEAPAPGPLALALVGAFLRALVATSQNSQKSTLPPSELRFIGYLSIHEARLYTGLPAATLRQAGREGRVGKAGRLYKRADLEAL